MTAFQACESTFQHVGHLEEMNIKKSTFGISKGRQLQGSVKLNSGIVFRKLFSHG